MKGWLIVLLFSGVTELRSFDYQVQEYDLERGTSTDEIVLSCDERADELREQIAEHSWDDPRGQGWYLNDGTGTIQGHIC